jgi:type IV pilus assembly protein PilC
LKVFKYSALDADGSPVDGEHTAADKENMLSYLRYNDLTPLSVEEVGESEEKPKAKVDKPEETGGMTTKAPPKSSLFQTISRKTTTVFTRQLATTLHAGLPLLRTISLLHRETSNPQMKSVLGSLGKRLQKGASLSAAMQDFPKIFDQRYVNLIKVGEMSGDLPHCVGRLAVLMEKEQALARKVKTAMAYPMFIFIFTSLMTYALVAYLIPLFSPMFLASGLNIERDYPLTHFLMKVSVLATDPVAMGVGVALIIGLFVGLKVASNKPGGRYAIDRAKLAIPFLGNAIKEVTAARFARSFSTLLQAGVPLVEALSQVAGASGNEVVSQRVNKVGRSIQGGEKLSDTLKKAAIFPDLLIQMTAIGEEAGSLPDMLERVADYYDEEVESSIASMTALLEPGMMVIIGGMVGIFVMGVLLPILGISSGMENQL